jgi:DNA repair protein
MQLHTIDRMDVPDNGGGFIKEHENDGGCDGCGSGLSFSASWFEAFGVVLCSACRSTERLISKATAKAAYLLTETDLSKLGSLSQPNPHNSRWKPMKLFLERQCEDMSVQKHGSLADLEELKESRREKRMEAIMEERKRSREEDEEGEEGEEEEEEGLALSNAQRQLRDKLRGNYSSKPHSVSVSSASAQLGQQVEEI